MYRKEEFIKWLSINSKLAQTTINKYANAINTISAELTEHGVNQGSIYYIIDSSKIESIKMKYLSIPELSAKDSRGNRMYSNALKHYKNFLETKRD